jgi:hypothetical protein
LAHGLIRASFVPDTQTQELRTLLRTRKQLVREKASHILLVQKDESGKVGTKEILAVRFSQLEETEPG